MIRVQNRWCGPLEVDLGSPLGRTRIPKAGVDLDVEFNDLKLPRATLAKLQKQTIEIIDLDAEDEAGGAGDAEKGSGAKGPAQGPGKAPSAGPAKPPSHGAEANGASAADQKGAPAPKAPAKAPEKKEDSK